jgi:HlyD family secretion protein
MARIALFAAVLVGASATPTGWHLPSTNSLAPNLAGAFSAATEQAANASGRLTALSDQIWTLLPATTGRYAPHFRTAPIERGDLAVTVQAAGTLNALVVVEIGSQISGLVTELFADFNSKVVAGQIIARVEPEMYEARVAQAEAELEMAETQVTVQRAQIARMGAELETAHGRHDVTRAQSVRAEIALDDAAQDMARKGQLVDRRVIAPGEWERVKNAHRSAETDLAAARAEQMAVAASRRAAQAAIEMAEAQLTNTEAQVRQKQAVLRQTRIDLDRTHIRTPVTGVVVNRAVAGGQTLAASLQSPTLFTIAQDLTQMQVEASVVEADIGRFSMGLPVVFTVDAYPERQFTGQVKQIRKAPQIVQNVVTYIVVVDAQNDEELLLPGMTANLQVKVAQRESILKVPNAALRFRLPGDESGGEVIAPAASSGPRSLEPGVPGRVFVLGSDDRPTPVSLRLGITDGRMTEVLEGEIVEGQRVVVALAPVPASEVGDDSVLVRFRLR